METPVSGGSSSRNDIPGGRCQLPGSHTQAEICLSLPHVMSWTWGSREAPPMLRRVR